MTSLGARPLLFALIFSLGSGSRSEGLGTEGSRSFRPGPMEYMGVNQQGFEEYLWLKDSSVMIRIPAGEFIMGSIDSNCDDDEQPIRTEFISEYYVDKCPVTNRQYRRFCAATGHWPPKDPRFPEMPDYFERYPDYPVVNIFWRDAKAYCDWAGKTLPTAAQWEKAARGTDGREYPWGNQPPDSGRFGNFADESGRKMHPGWTSVVRYDDSYPHTSPVGSFPAGASPYGCLDMAGNVWQWCNGWYSKDYYVRCPDRDPRGPSRGWNRIQRGGCWYSLPRLLRSANRSWLDPDLASEGHGFRCAYPQDKNLLQRVLDFLARKD